MLPDFRSNHCSIFWRAIYIVCMVVVFSYIFFDVLDLDGSDFPLKRHPFERTAIVTKVANDTDHAYAVGRPELSVDVRTLSRSFSGHTLWVRVTRESRFSALVSARTRGYRIALPRSSPTDPFQ